MQLERRSVVLPVPQDADSLAEPPDRWRAQHNRHDPDHTPLRGSSHLGFGGRRFINAHIADIRFSAMLTRPADLPDPKVNEALRAGWGLEPIDVEYSAVGFGSHHWQVGDDAGGRWFLSVDDVVARRRAVDETPDTAYERLRAALLTARASRDSGAAFVVAPVRTTDGDVVHRIGNRYAAALYPFVDGRHHDFDHTLTRTEQHQVLADHRRTSCVASSCEGGRAGGGLRTAATGRARASTRRAGRAMGHGTLRPARASMVCNPGEPHRSHAGRT